MPEGSLDTNPAGSNDNWYLISLSNPHSGPSSGYATGFAHNADNPSYRPSGGGSRTDTRTLITVFKAISAYSRYNKNIDPNNFRSYGFSQKQISRWFYQYSGTFCGVMQTIIRESEAGRITPIFKGGGKSFGFTALVFSGIIYGFDMYGIFDQYGLDGFKKYEFWHPTAQLAGGFVGALIGAGIGQGWFSVGSSIIVGTAVSYGSGWIVDKIYGK